MAFNTSQAAPSVLTDAQKLMRELSETVVDTLVSNAPRLRSFDSRREELLRIDTKYLFYFATALVVLALSRQRLPGALDVDKTLEATAMEFSRRATFSGGPRTDADRDRARAELLANLRGMHGPVDLHYGRMLNGESDEKTAFEVITINLMRAFPGTKALLSEDLELLSAVTQRFAAKCLDASAGA